MTDISCHTGALAEVSIKNGEWITKTEFIWIFRYAQNDKFPKIQPKAPKKTQATLQKIPPQKPSNTPQKIFCLSC